MKAPRGCPNQVIVAVRIRQGRKSRRRRAIEEEQDAGDGYKGQSCGREDPELFHRFQDFRQSAILSRIGISTFQEKPAEFPLKGTGASARAAGEWKRIRLEGKPAIAGPWRNGASRRQSAIAESAIAGAPGSAVASLLKALMKIGYSKAEPLTRVQLAREPIGNDIPNLRYATAYSIATMGKTAMA